jgi:hypothetical protein
MDAAELAALKKKRGQAKGVVTRHRNNLNQYVVEELPGDAKETLQKLQEAFRNFTKVHDSYHGNLQDDDDIETSDSYFAEAQKEYVETFKIARDWLKSLTLEQKPDAVKTESSESKDSVKELLSLLNMPKVDFVKFEGDPLKYHNFKSMFDQSVKGIEDKGVKLTRLLQCTAGKAYDAISACGLMNSELGYDQARKVLEDRFGNEYLVSERLIRNICNGKQLKTPEDLVTFADELTHCQMILEGMDKLQEIESQRYILDISNRLQGYVRTKWKKKALEIKDTSTKYPTFSEFVNFVTKEAKHASDPLYGNFHSKSHSGGNSGNSKSASFFSSGASNIDKRSFKCVLC